jgi:hypothetical protein
MDQSIVNRYTSCSFIRQFIKKAVTAGHNRQHQLVRLLPTYNSWIMLQPVVEESKVWPNERLKVDETAYDVVFLFMSFLINYLLLNQSA